MSNTDLYVNVQSHFIPNGLKLERTQMPIRWRNKLLTHAIEMSLKSIPDKAQSQ